MFLQMKARDLIADTQEKLPMRLRIFEKFPYVFHVFFTIIPLQVLLSFIWVPNYST